MRMKCGCILAKRKGGIIMKKESFRKVESFASRTVANLAMRTAEYTADRLCVFIFHQPKMPDEVKKLRRF